jgi:hypothetical protein
VANDPVKPTERPASPKVTTDKKPASKVITKAVATKAAAPKKAVAKKAAPAKPATPKISVPATAKKVTPKKTAPKAKPVATKPAKVKMERDSFTMPKDEYAQIGALKDRLAKLGQPAKKSELLRAGIKLLIAMSDNTLKTTMAKIPVIKTGRPKKK